MKKNKDKFWIGFFYGLFLWIIGYSISIRLYKENTDEDITCEAGAKVGFALSTTLIFFTFALILLVVFAK